MALSILISAIGFTPAYADPLTPVREQVVTLQETAHIWWLSAWDGNQVVCELSILHEDLPTPLEVYNQCGDDDYELWIDSPECNAEDVKTCEGAYLHFVRTESITRDINIDLPTASASLSLDDCSETSTEFTCHGNPKLVISGSEPLPNESIIGIRGIFAGISFSCKGSVCEVPLRPSPEEGFQLVFWAESSYGDLSPHYNAMVRINAADQDDWQVSVLSDRLRTSRTPSCGLTWQSIPPSEGLPKWLQTIDTPEALSTDFQYAHLAKRLVQQGIISTQQCPNLGFDGTGALNACGINAAQSTVFEWQNRFDLEIYSTANKLNVPPHLLKAIFGQESQFWPGIYLSDPDEAGLGKLTEMGADITLLWNAQFFNEFCPLILDELVCSNGYSGLVADERAMLRGALFQEVDASCLTCTDGIDLKRANSSVRVFAETLLASCDQVGQMIRNTTEQNPGEVSSYVDLWKITIASYHSGPGCVANAIGDAWLKDETLSWSSVALSLEPDCPSGLEYVNKVTSN